MEFPPEPLKTLWAPWRIEYFKLRADHRIGDFLSAAAHSSDDRAHLVVARNRQAFLIMNRYPYAAGHLMAVPYRKVAAMEDLSEGEVLDLWAMALLAQRLLRDVLQAQGFNLGLNLGDCAGAGVADHLHLHIVPRWPSDRNFMAVLADTTVLPEMLEALYDKLVEHKVA